MGGGKSSGQSQTQAVLTPEQRRALEVQTSFLENTALPAYSQTIGGAKDVYNTVAPAVTGAANNATGVAQRTGALNQGLGTVNSVLGTTGVQGTAGALSGLAGNQAALGQNLLGKGGAQALGAAGNLINGPVSAGGGASGGGDLVSSGQNFQNRGAQGLQGLFDQNYESGQINAALQAGRESARESQAGQNAMYGAAGGLGSARMALADSNLASLNAQRQATAAAGAQSQVQQNRSAAANSLLGAGSQNIGAGASITSSANAANAAMQSAATQAAATRASAGANLLSSILGAGNQASSNAGSALGTAQTGYGALGSQGAGQLGAANQAAGAQINYAGAPQDIYGKYASVIFGTPQGNTTPNFAGTQGSNQSGGSKGFKI